MTIIAVYLFNRIILSNKKENITWYTLLNIYVYGKKSNKKSICYLTPFIWNGVTKWCVVTESRSVVTHISLRIEVEKGCEECISKMHK